MLRFTSSLGNVLVLASPKETISFFTGGITIITGEHISLLPLLRTLMIMCVGVVHGEHFLKVSSTPFYAAACRDLLNKYVKELESST